MYCLDDLQPKGRERGTIRLVRCTAWIRAPRLAGKGFLSTFSPTSRGDRRSAPSDWMESAEEGKEEENGAPNSMDRTLFVSMTMKAPHIQAGSRECRGISIE